VAGLTALLTAAAVAALVIGLVLTSRAHQAAQEQAASLRRQLYPADMRLAYEHFVHEEADQLAALLARHEPGPGQKDLRGFEWYYLKALADALPRERVCHRGHGCDVMSAIFTPDGREVVSGDENGAIHFWDAATGDCRAVWHGHKDDVNGLHFSPDGRTLGRRGWKVRLWEASSGKQLAVLSANSGELEGLCFSPDGKHLIAPGANGWLYLWDVLSRKVQRWPHAPGRRIYTAAFSPNGRQIASAGSDDHLKVWDAQTLRLLFEVGVPGQPFYDVCYSPEGARLITADGIRTIRMWDAASGRLLRVLGEAPCGGILSDLSEAARRPVGLAYWLAQLQNGAPFSTIAEGFVSSDEFFNNAASQR
jgi:hypothetical protein